MNRPDDRLPASKPTADDRWDDDEIPRHPPVVPKDGETPLESLGDAIADVVTGGEASQATVEQAKEVDAPKPGEPAPRR
jgi:hypothetical protein